MKLDLDSQEGQDGPHILPHHVPSIKLWLDRREAAVVVDPPSTLEEHFGDEVAHIWARARHSDADMVALMHGAGGLSVLVRALLQWRAAEPVAGDWAAIALDVAAALNLLKEQPVGVAFNCSVESLLLEHDAPRANEARALILARSTARMDRYRCAKKSTKTAKTAAKDIPHGKPPKGMRLRKRRV